MRRSSNDMNQSQQTSCHFINISIAYTLNSLGNLILTFCSPVLPVLIMYKQKMLAFLYQIMVKNNVL